MATQDDFLLWEERWKKRINAHLRVLLPKGRDPLSVAMRYATLPGGKLLRPLLCLAAAEDCGAKDLPVNAACALELIHAYSLVHDDLPAMDDDDLRRNKPSCHVRFGEATAILAGDGLHSLAFAALADSNMGSSAVALLADASGCLGMVAGQSQDISKRAGSVKALAQMHRLKTGALFGAALSIGALAAGAGKKLSEAYAELGRQFGLCFQIADDIADEFELKKQNGRKQKLSRDGGNATYVGLLGIDKARAELAKELRGLTAACGKLAARPVLSRVRQIVQKVFAKELN